MTSGDSLAFVDKGEVLQPETPPSTDEEEEKEEVMMAEVIPILGALGHGAHRGHDSPPSLQPRALPATGRFTAICSPDRLHQARLRPVASGLAQGGPAAGRRGGGQRQR